MPDLLQAVTPEVPQTPVEQGRELTDVEADERAYAQLPESKEAFLEQEDRDLVKLPEQRLEMSVPTKPTAAAPAPVAAPKDEVTIKVEKIMEEGLGELYASLPDKAKPIFREKGEQAATEIAGMVRSFKLNVSRVIRLIRDWLLVVPKVNRFYLEQEAKIKTDELIDLVEARKEDLTKQP